ncbi:hypothetical protein ACQKH5_17475 [Hyphomonas sp. NPDC076900]|jgi:hypothetical protein|uniref:hypothetical protein n=1 Tax=unclassified Hyphomonas TaxID=2630699 RepID=UPI003CFF03FF
MSKSFFVWLAVTATLFVLALFLVPWALGTNDPLFVGILLIVVVTFIGLGFYRGFRR